MKNIYFFFLRTLIDEKFHVITVELAMIMDRLYRGVCYAGIDTDPELKYPKVNIKNVFFFNQFNFAHVTFEYTLNTNREPVALHSPINKVTLRQSLLVLSNCNMATLTNVSKLSHMS